MIFKVSRLLLGILLLIGNVSLSQAVIYAPSMNEAKWLLELSPFECRMWQPIPVFGDAVFSHRAGENQQFHLVPKKLEMSKGKASLVSAAPVWNADKKSARLGHVVVSRESRSINLGKKMAFQLLNKLYDGMSPLFSKSSWFESDEKVQVGLSSVHFRRAYTQYKDCLVGLLPVNYDQIKRSRIHFETAKSELTPASRTLLDNIIVYVNTDTAVTGFYVDGHTDDVGRRLYNLDLSKRRAEEVTRYLTAKGIDEAMITTRYHGERYPVAKNTSSKNRAMNRRVTVRIERDSL